MLYFLKSLIHQDLTYGQRCFTTQGNEKTEKEEIGSWNAANINSLK